jgi:hypothetical protein
MTPPKDNAEEGQQEDAPNSDASNGTRAQAWRSDKRA